MSLSFKSLSALAVTTAFASNGKIVYQAEDGNFYNAQLNDLKTYITDDVNSRIDLLESSSSSGPSIWPVARTMTLTGPVTGMVSFDGSANFSLATTIGPNAVSFGNVEGLTSRLNDIDAEIDTNLELLESELQNKADLNHTHQSTVDTSSSTSYPDTPLGIWHYSASTGNNVLSVKHSNGSAFRFKVAANSISVSTHTANGWDTTFDLYHTGNFNPANYALLSGADFSGIVKSRVSLGLTDGTGALRSTYRTDVNTNSVYLTALTSASVQTAALKLDGTGLYYQAASGDPSYKVYTEQSFNKDALMFTGDGLAEVFSKAPITYADSTNCNNLPAGRAVVSKTMPNAPASTQNYWYIETLIIDESSGAKLQRAFGTVSGELWLRQYSGTAWGDWRRVWDNQNMSTSSYVRFGDYGIGGAAATVTNIDGLNANGWYSYVGGQGPDNTSTWLVNHQGNGTQAAQLAISGAHYYMRGNSGSGWSEWAVVGLPEGFDLSGKWDTSLAVARGFQGPALLTTMASNDVPGLSFFAANTSTATDKPAGAQTGPLLTLQLQSGQLSGGSALQLSAVASDGSNPDLWVRTSLSGSFGGWARVYTNANLDISSFMKKGTGLGASTDLNTISETGYYQCILDSSATTDNHYPVTLGGVLVVTSPTNNYIWQEYWPRDGSGKWTRSYYGSAWSVWSKVWNSAEGGLTNAAITAGSVNVDKTTDAIGSSNPGYWAFTGKVDAASVVGIWVSKTHDVSIQNFYNGWDTASINMSSTGVVDIHGTALTYSSNTIWHAANQFALGPTQATARTALGIGTSANYPIGTSGASVPLLNGSGNVWSGSNTFNTIAIGTARGYIYETVAGNGVVGIRAGVAGSETFYSFGADGNFRVPNGTVYVGGNAVWHSGIVNPLNKDVGGTVNGALTVVTSGQGSTLIVQDTGSNGANLQLTGNGTTTPNKTIRATNGRLEFVNSAYSSVVMAMSDDGYLRAAGFTSSGTSGLDYTPGGVRLMIRSDGGNATIDAVKNDNSAFDVLRFRATGMLFNGNQVATTADLTGKVDKSGSTMSGLLTITSQDALYLTNNGYGFTFNNGGNGNLGIWDSKNSRWLAVFNQGTNSLNLSLATLTLAASDTALVTRGFDLATSGKLSGFGRWGLYMEPSRIGIGTPAGTDASNVKVFKYNADSTIANEYTVWHAGNCTPLDRFVGGTVVAQTIFTTPYGASQAVNGAALLTSGGWGGGIGLIDSTGCASIFYGGGMLRFGMAGSSTGAYTAVVAINGSGVITAGDFAISSDRSYKDNIRSMTLSPGRLNPVRYTLRSTGEEDFGFIAQDIQQNYPEAVGTDANGKLAVKYQKLVAVVSKQINDAEDTISLLTSQLLHQASKIEALEHRLNQILG